MKVDPRDRSVLCQVLAKQAARAAAEWRSTPAERARLHVMLGSKSTDLIAGVVSALEALEGHLTREAAK